MSKSSPTKSSAARKATAKRPAKTRGAKAKANAKTAVDVAIATELAPAAAIAVLEKSSQAPGAPDPALDVLVAGVSDAAEDGKVRVHLMFDSGAVLPVEMSSEAGKALEAGLAERRLGTSQADVTP
jgi:hypothetical protein